MRSQLLSVVALLTGVLGAHPAQAEVQCQIYAAQLQFGGMQAGFAARHEAVGEVEVRCQSVSATASRVLLQLLIEPSATAHALDHSNGRDQLSLQLYRDAARTEVLSAAPGQNQLWSTSLLLESGQSQTLVVPVYARLQLQASAAAGLYQQHLPLRLIYE